MSSSTKKTSDSFAEVTVIDSEYNHFRDYVDIIRVYKCKLCPFCSPLEHVITSHMSEVHFPRRCFLCKQCLFVFESREQLIEHIEAGHGSQSLNCSFGEPTPHGSPSQALRLSTTYPGEERIGKKTLDDGGVNGQSVTSSTSNLANIPDDPASGQQNQKDDSPASPNCNNEIRRPPTKSPSPVSQTSANLCTSSSQASQGRNKPNSGQLMGLGVRKMLQRRHSLGGSHPTSELHMGFFCKSVKTEPVSPKESTGTKQQGVRPVIKDIASADSLTESNESGQRDSLSRCSMVSCPEDMRSKDVEVIKRDVAVVRGIPFRPEATENVRNEKSRVCVDVPDKRSDTTPSVDEHNLSYSSDLPFSKTQTLPQAVSALDLGTHSASEDPKVIRNDAKVYPRDKRPTSLREIVSHVMEEHRHNSEVMVRKPVDIPPQQSSDFQGQVPQGLQHGMEFQGPAKPRARSYSITEGEIPNLHEHNVDALNNSKDGLRNDLLSTEYKQYGQTGSGVSGSLPLWYPYHQQSLDREQGKFPSRMLPWPYRGHFPGINQSQPPANAPQTSKESVLYRYLSSPHMKRRRNSIGVINPAEANRVGLPWPPHLPTNELVQRFGPGSQTHMPWGGTIPGYIPGYSLPQMGDKVPSPNSNAKHGSQVSPNRFGEYLVEIERKEGNRSNTSDQTSSEGTQDLAQVDDITRQVNSAIRSTGGFYSEQNGALDDNSHDFDGEDDENRSDDGRKRSRKSTFNIYREIPERKRKLDRVEEEKIKKSYNADGSFDYFTLTGWKAYKCDLCKKRRFKTASELEDHKRLKHAGDMSEKSRKLVFHSVHVDENDFEESN